MALLPFIRAPELVLLGVGALGRGFPPVPLSIKPFGVLVASGVAVGGYLAIRQARRCGLHERYLAALLLWVLAGGFVGGHLFDVLWYYPERVGEQPWSLLMLWDGQSSFGGFTGATIGALAFARRYRIGLFPYADVLASALPAGWTLGRLGCALVHDHPGRPSELWFAVAYPAGGRLDLGFMEMVLTVPLAVAFLVLCRRPRPEGFYLAAVTMAYAPLRCALDFLRATEPSWPDVRVADPRYLALTPAQWGSLLLLGIGAWFFARLSRSTAGEPWRGGVHPANHWS